MPCQFALCERAGREEGSEPRMEELRRLCLRISPAQAGATVEKILRNELHVSAACIRRAKRLPEGITLDGERVFTNASVRAGSCLSIQIASLPTHIPPMEAPLDILFEDEDLLIVNKAAQLMVHPRGDAQLPTLANHLCHYYQTKGSSAQIHLVNRLDRGTSGLMAVAKHPHAHARLMAQLHEGSFLREYYALCDGIPNPAAGVLDAPIGRADGSPILREVRPDGAAARTHYRTLSSGFGRSLLALRLETGRTHQIRVHLAHIGCPVTGDFLYGSEQPALPQRFALHCGRLRFSHPISGEEMEHSAPLPPEIAALLAPPEEQALAGQPLYPLEQGEIL